ncbi:Piso0_005406 [Millerozyma farinosa CBS 7064]|uniref:Protein PBN1 n=1 Tax=Pichia sorbitophila (strain ATCC MYA-4447 / BCRC 22081 / CBS 7064 / NBRC 10061 / NRRL Y-12695) TaxID=559304 RepID=G8Y508_PICSO|nr:Piso0_005406 [Millerozyma farinosa CBS 7064]
MIRQRSTIYNTGSSHDSVIQDARANSLKLNTSNFLGEDKIVQKSTPFRFIDKIRVQWFSFDNQDFLFSKYSRGLNVFCKPNLHAAGFSKNEFFKEVRGFLTNYIDIPEDAWIVSKDALFYYDSSLFPDRLIQSISSLIGHETTIDLERPFNLDYVYENDQCTVKLNGHTTSQLTYERQSGKRREVGLFLREPGISVRDDIVLAGVRAVFEDKADSEAQDNNKNSDFLQKTLFHVKSRQRKLARRYESKIQPNGLHPFIELEFDKDNKIAQEKKLAFDDDVLQCKLFCYLNLPRSAFIDKYQLPKYLEPLVTFGNNDLELPEYKIDSWGSEFLFEVKMPELSNFQIPLHSRYQLRNETSGLSFKQLPEPIIFYGCDVRQPEFLNKSPFDNRIDVGGNYERFFTNDTVFYHFESNQELLQFTIPTAKDSFHTNQMLTFICIGCGTVYILYKLLLANFASVSGRAKVAPSKKND